MSFLARALAAAFLALAPALAWGQGVQIPALPPASALGGTESIVVDQSGTKRATPSQIMAYMLANGGLASTSAKGLMPQLPGNPNVFLNGAGGYTAPPTGSGGGTAQTLFPPFAGYVAGGYYINDTTGTGTAPGADSLRLQPIVIQQTATLSGLAFRLTTASSGGNVQGVCYDSDATTLRPTGTPIRQSASVSTTTIGNLDLTFTTSIQLTPKLYWCGVRFDNATAVGTSTSNLIGNLTSRVYGFRTLGEIATTSTTTAAGLVYSAPFASAFPDLTSVNPGTPTGLNVPAVWFKIASVP